MTGRDDDLGVGVDRALLEQLGEVARSGDTTDELWPTVKEICRQVVALGGVSAEELEAALRRRLALDEAEGQI